MRFPLPLLLTTVTPLVIAFFISLLMAWPLPAAGNFLVVSLSCYMVANGFMVMLISISKLLFYVAAGTHVFFKKRWQIWKTNFFLHSFSGLSISPPVSFLLKVLTILRLNPLLVTALAAVGELVCDSQGAFIPGRSLTHNAAVATEILRGYGTRRISPRCAVKVDLYKAYESLSWRFIEKALSYVNFPRKFIELVMECVSSPTFSVLINGIPQGDPMSPYLLELCMDIFSRKLTEMATTRVSNVKKWVFCT